MVVISDQEKEDKIYTKVTVKDLTETIAQLVNRDHY